MEGNERVRKLKWLCRRGMKELDILLERFIEQNSDALAKGAWPEFEALLQTEDDLLWDWFLDTSSADAKPYRDLLEKVRSARG
jgi:antitoxin CptB